jgi:hypothetical protein
MHWLLARVRRIFPSLPQRSAIDATFDRHLAPGAVAAECAYLDRPDTQTFERTYGWAWLLQLAGELARSDDDNARRWAAQLAPMTDRFIERFLGYLPKAYYPIRHGTHANSAFGLALAIDYARRVGHPGLEAIGVATARRWFGNDRDGPAAWEPSGADFLSPVLMEADLMRRVLPAGRYGAWLSAFLPQLVFGVPAPLLRPARVTDRTDPQIVHLDGLNLSRAWCMRGIAESLPKADPRVPVLDTAIAAHLRAGLAGVDSEHYAGAHWLASFALLALSDK